jgi:hypothetical protein
VSVGTPALGAPRRSSSAAAAVSPTLEPARPGLAKFGILLYYLPADSSELNCIEPVFKQVKHHDMPTRKCTIRADLR